MTGLKRVEQNNAVGVERSRGCRRYKWRFREFSPGFVRESLPESERRERGENSLKRLAEDAFSGSLHSALEISVGTTVSRRSGRDDRV
jgi:hypothetical protein